MIWWQVIIIIGISWLRDADWQEIGEIGLRQENDEERDETPTTLKSDGIIAVFESQRYFECKIGAAVSGTWAYASYSCHRNKQL